MWDKLKLKIYDNENEMTTLIHLWILNRYRQQEMYLKIPSHNVPFPVYPLWQWHVNDPILLEQTPYCWWQLCFPFAHSSRSAVADQTQLRNMLCLIRGMKSSLLKPGYKFPSECSNWKPVIVSQVNSILFHGWIA